ncbi:MAG: hypothetical protein PHD48_06760 [Alphaproteobacteria bacterium]|nr:hypothetical protein [Alphaproteobacteria bacterium]
MGSLLLFTKNRDRPIICWDLRNAIPSAVVFTRASTATSFDADGMLRLEAINAPRFDHHPTTHEALGLLIEGQRTNILLQSIMTGSNGGTPDVPYGWSSSNVSSASDGGIPLDSIFGGNDGAKARSFTTTDSKNFIAAAVASVSASTTYIFSVLVEANASGQPLSSILAFSNAPTGTVGSYPKGSDYIPSAGERVEIKMVVGTTSGSALFRLGCGIDIARTGTVVLSRPQVEVGYFATSYIPTTNTAATRAADFLGTSSIPWFNANQGTFVVEGRMLGIFGAYQNIVDLSANGPLNQNAFGLNVTNVGIGTGNAWVAGTNKYAYITDHTADAPFKQAMSYKAAEYKITLNGTRATSGSLLTAELPTNIDTLDFAYARYESPKNQGSMWLRSFKYWNRSSNDTEMERITQ